jgi:MFS family permease
MRALLITVVLTGLTAGALEVGLPALAIHLGAPGLGGVLLALWSLGSLLGGLAYGAGSWAMPLEVRYLGLLLAVAAMTSLLAFATTAASACALSFVAGLGQAPVLASQFSLVNELSPPSGATVAFAWNTAALVIGVAAGSAVAGAIVRPAGFSLPFLVAAASALVAAAGSLTVRSATTGRHVVIFGSARRSDR